MTIDISTADNKNHLILRATRVEMSVDGRTRIETWDSVSITGQALFTDETSFTVEVS